MATVCDVIGCGCVAKRYWISIDLVDRDDNGRRLELDRDLCDHHVSGMVNAIESVLAGKTLFSTRGEDHE